MPTARANFGLVSPTHQRPSMTQSLQGVLIPDSVKTGATSYKLDKSQAIGYYKIRK